MTRGFESDALKTLVYERDVASVAIDYCVKETGDYYLVILNESANPVDITIEIAAKRRETSPRTRIEVTINCLAELARTKEPLHQVFRRIPKRPPASASNDDAEKSDWPAGS